MFLLISCAGGNKTEKKDKAVTIEEHFQLAYSAAERANLDEAASEYQKVLKLDSKNAKAHLNLGIVYGRQGKWKKEVSEYEKQSD
jgi:Tfp pilus assembly protein PilF